MQRSWGQVRGGPIFHTGFSILLAKGFRWMGGYEKPVGKDCRILKTHPMYNSWKQILLLYFWNNFQLMYSSFHIIILSKTVNMKCIIVILSGRVFVGSLKGFGVGWVGSKESFHRKDWKPRTENCTTPYEILPARRLVSPASLATGDRCGLNINFILKRQPKLW